MVSQMVFLGKWLGRRLQRSWETGAKPPKTSLKYTMKIQDNVSLFFIFLSLQEDDEVMG